MKMIFISGMSLYPWGGSEELWSQSALRSCENGHTVAASVPFWPNLSPRVEALAKKGIKLYFHQSSHSPFIARAWRGMRRKLGYGGVGFQWLRREKPDLVVISQGGITDGLESMNFCREIGLPFVTICQCNSESWWPTDEVAAAMAGVYASAQKVFCVSRRNLELLERQIACSLPNASIVRNPYNVSPDESPEWPAGSGLWRLACVARLEPAAKGQDLLLQVLSRPQWRKRPIQVSLYGTGSSEQTLRHLVQHLGLRNVRFRGYAENVEQIWKQNSLLILPSRYEGLPLALIEAMWCARPSIVTDVGGCSELCIDQKTGFVAPAATPDLVEEALERAWNQRRNWRDLGRAARARAEELIPKDPVGEFCNQLRPTSHVAAELCA